MNSLLEITTPVPSISSEQFATEPSSYLGYNSDTTDLYISVGSEIQKFGRIEADGISLLVPEVIQNALSVMKALPGSVLRKLSVTDITPTGYGTLVFDWYNAKEDVVSLEIGTTHMGGFCNFDDEYESLGEEYISNFLLTKFAFINAINRLYRSQLEAYG